VQFGKVGVSRSGKWAVSMSEYKDGVVGAKSKNLAALRGTLPDWIALPASVTLPFGCFEQVLDHKANRAVKKVLEDAAKRVPESPSKYLQECRCVVLLPILCLVACSRDLDSSRPSVQV
jgi:alpha-glucan, water dikinase